MNEEAILDSYNLFVQNGYKKSLDEYKELLASNPNALNDSYGLFQKNGYSKSLDEYKSLMGISKEKAVESFASEVNQKKNITESPSGEGFSVYQAPDKEDEQGLLMNTISGLNKGFYQNLIGNPIKGIGTLYEKSVSLLPRQLRSETGKGIISDSLIGFGNYFNKAIDEISPQDESFKNSLTDQFAQAFGQVASTILTAGAGGAGSIASKGASMLVKPLGAKAAALAATKEAGKQIVSPTGISSALTMGQSEYERAKEAGATDDQAFEAFYKNAVTGSVLETIPVMQFMKRFNNSSKGGIVDYIKTKGVAGLTGGVEEMTTEVLQGLYANKTAQEIYDENQSIFEGLTEAGGVGFGVGFLLNAMGANVKILRKEGRNDEANVLENQIESLQSQAENGPPPIYKVNGLKIESPDIVNDMIERMSASDLSKINIDITNDPVLKNKLQDKIITSSIMEQVREANPELNEPSLKAITELEKQLTLLDGNKTQAGKDKAAAIRTQIKNIQENQLQEESVVEAVVAETPEVTQKRVERIAEIENTLKLNEASSAVEGGLTLPDELKTKLETELQTLKAEQDAIQEQAADEGLLRTEQPEMGLQQVGEGNVQPEGVTAGTEEVISPEGETQKEDVYKSIIDREFTKIGALSLDKIPTERIVESDSPRKTQSRHNEIMKTVAKLNKLIKCR